MERQQTGQIQHLRVITSQFLSQWGGHVFRVEDLRENLANWALEKLVSLRQMLEEFVVDVHQV